MSGLASRTRGRFAQPLSPILLLGFGGSDGQHEFVHGLFKQSNLSLSLGGPTVACVEWAEESGALFTRNESLETRRT